MANDGLPEQRFTRESIQRIARVVRAAEHEATDIDRQGRGAGGYSNPRTALVRVQATGQTAGMYPGAMQQGQQNWNGVGSFLSDINGGTQDCWLFAPNGLGTTTVCEATAFGSYQDGKPIFHAGKISSLFTPVYAKIFYSGAAQVTYPAISPFNTGNAVAHTLASSGTGVSITLQNASGGVNLLNDHSGVLTFYPGAVSGSVSVIHHAALQFTGTGSGNILVGSAIGAVPGAGGAILPNWQQLPVSFDSLGNFWVQLPPVLDSATANAAFEFTLCSTVALTLVAAFVFAEVLGQP